MIYYRVFSKTAIESSIKCKCGRCGNDSTWHCAPLIFTSDFDMAVEKMSEAHILYTYEYATSAFHGKQLVNRQNFKQLQLNK